MLVATYLGTRAATAKCRNNCTAEGYYWFFIIRGIDTLGRFVTIQLLRVPVCFPAYVIL